MWSMFHITLIYHLLPNAACNTCIQPQQTRDRCQNDWMIFFDFRLCSKNKGTKWYYSDNDFHSLSHTHTQIQTPAKRPAASVTEHA